MNSAGPKNRWTGRLNSAVRRSSTMLAFGRSGSSRPSSIRSRSSSDATKLDTSAEPLAAYMMPSPISESPLKETDATASVGHSALSQELPRPSSPEPLDGPTSPVEYVPPPVMDSLVGNPGAFRDQDEQLPQPIVVSDPHRQGPSAPASAPHNITPAYEEVSTLRELDAISVHKTQYPVHPATGVNSTSETADETLDHEDDNHPMERGRDPTSIPLTDPINPPVTVVPKHPSPIDPAQQDPPLVSYDSVPVGDSKTSILVSSPCSEPRSNGSVHLDYASVL